MKHYRLNVKLLMWLGGIALGVSIVVYFLHGFQQNRNAAFLLRQAEEYKADGKVDKAINYYSQYLNFRDDSDAHAAMAKLAADAADEPDSSRESKMRAYRVHVAANLRYPELDDVRRRLIDFSIAVQDFAATREHIAYLEAKGIKDSQFDIKLARCELFVDDYVKAEKLLSGVVGYDLEKRSFDAEPGPNAHEIDAFELLAVAFRKDNQNAQAELVMNQCVAWNPNSGKAALARSFHWEQVKKEPEAKAELMRAYELDPNDALTMMSVFTLKAEAKDYSEAQKLLDQAAEKFPKRTDVYIRQAQLAREQKDYEGAKKHLQEGFEKAGEPGVILRLLVEYQIETNDLKGVRETCELMRERGLADELIKFAEARVMMTEGKTHDAIELFVKIRPAMPRFGEDYVQTLDLLLGRCYANIGQPDRQLYYFTTAMDRQKQSFQAMYGKAQALHAMGRYAEAEDIIRAMIDGTTESDEMQANLLSLALQAAAHNRNGKITLDDVERLAKKQHELSKNDMTDMLLKAELFTLKGQPAEAIALLTKITVENPKELRAWIMLARNVSRIESDIAKVRDVLELAQKNVGERPELLLEWMALFVREGRPNGLASLHKLEGRINAQDAGVKYALNTQLGACYLALGETPDARRCWELAIAHEPANGQLRQLMFELSIEEKNQLAIDAQLKALLESSHFGPQSALYKFCLAMSKLLPLYEARKENRPFNSTELDSINTVRRLADEAIRARSDWGPPYRILGELDQLDGNNQRAMTNYINALKFSPGGQANTARRLAVLQYHAQQFPSFLKTVNDYIGPLAPDDPLQGMRASVEVHLGQLDNALLAAKRSVDANPNSAKAHLHYGQLSDLAKRTEQAEAEIRRALELDPNVPNGTVTLVRQLRQAGKLRDAHDVINKAPVSVTGDLLTMATLYQIVGDNKRAVSYLTQAVSQQPNELQPLHMMIQFLRESKKDQECVPHLRRIIELASASTKQQDIEELYWARRTLGGIIASTHNYQDIVEARELIEQNAINGELQRADIEAIVDMLAGRSDAESREIAKRMLEKLSTSQGSLSPREEFALGQILEREGNWQQAKLKMVSAITKLDKAADAIVALTQAHIKHGEYAEATKLLDELAKLLPQLPPADSGLMRSMSHELRATIYFRTGKVDEAVKEIEKLVPTPLMVEQYPLLGVVARLLEKIDQGKVAEKKLMEYQDNPGVSLALGGLLARRGDMEQAFARFDQARKGQPIVEILALAMEAFRLHPELATSGRLLQLIAWAQEAKLISNDPREIDLNMAEIFEFEGRYVDAMKTYRIVLAQPAPPASGDDPVQTANQQLRFQHQTAVAKNNLAFLLAIEGGTDADLNEALKMINESIDFFGPTSDVIDTRGMINLELGKLKESLKDLRSAAKDAPTPAKMLHLALAEHEAKNLPAARSAIQSIEFKPRVLSPKEEKRYRDLLEQLK